jgi:MraZ protein
VERCGGEWNTVFSGAYYHSLDSKNRLIIPSKLREAADRIKKNDDFYLTRGFEGCLYLFPSVYMKEIADRIHKLSFTGKDARSFQRLFFTKTVQVKFDSQGRIVIPESHMKLGRLKKNCAILGVADRIEIWDEDAWKEFDTKHAASYDVIAENLYVPESGEAEA